MPLQDSTDWLDRLAGDNLDALYRYALRLCHGGAADAEDLVQDAMLRAVRSADQLKAPDAARAWLFQIVTRTHLNRIRASGRRMDTLDPGLRPALWLSDVEGFTQREVADMLAVPAGTVASRVFRARRALRSQLRGARQSAPARTGRNR